MSSLRLLSLLLFALLPLSARAATDGGSSLPGAGNVPPVPVISLNTSHQFDDCFEQPCQWVFAPGESIIFSAQQSYDPDGYIAAYWWYIDGAYISGSYNALSIYKTFSLPAGVNSETHTVRMRLRDNGYVYRETTVEIVVRRPLEKYYYHTDHLGSVRAVVDDAGTVVEHRDYYPFGLEMPGRTYLSGVDEASEHFTGKEQDGETGLHYYGARYYMAALGRWGAVDPLAASYPGLSPYNYVANNPASFVDPDGKAPDMPEAAERSGLLLQLTPTDEGPCMGDGECLRWLSVFSSPLVHEEIDRNDHTWRASDDGPDKPLKKSCVGLGCGDKYDVKSTRVAISLMPQSGGDVARSFTQTLIGGAIGVATGASSISWGMKKGFVTQGWGMPRFRWDQLSRGGAWLAVTFTALEAVGHAWDGNTRGLVESVSGLVMGTLLGSGLGALGTIFGGPVVGLASAGLGSYYGDKFGRWLGGVFYDVGASGRYKAPLGSAMSGIPRYVR